jgi:type IX secretion system substrate protein
MKNLLITGMVSLLFFTLAFSQAGKLNDVFLNKVSLRSTLKVANGFMITGRLLGGAQYNCPADGKAGLIWLAKLDKDKNLLWEKCYGGNGEDDPKKIVPDGKGGYVIFSTSSSNKGDINCHIGNDDIWVLHIDSVGNILDSRCFGGTAQDILTDAIRTKDGGYVFATMNNSSNGDFPGHYGSFLSFDVWVIKLDSNLNKTWSFWWGGSSDEIDPVLTEMVGGSIVIAVSSSSDDYDVPTNYNSADTWIIKLDTGGKKVWQRHYGAYNSQDIPQDIIITPDTGLLMVGYRALLCPFTTSDIGWVLKMDKDGKMEWEGCYGSKGNAEFNQVAFLPQRQMYLIVGSASFKGYDVKDNYGLEDIWMLLIDMQGNLLWSQNYGGSRGDGIYSKDIIVSESLAMISANSQSNDFDLQNSGISGFKSWLFDIEVYPLGLSAPGKVPVAKVMPNPFSDYLVIKFNEPYGRETNIEIYDISGQPAVRAVLPASKQVHTLSTVSLPTGMYLYRIVSGGKLLQTGKVVKTVR